MSENELTVNRGIIKLLNTYCRHAQYVCAKNVKTDRNVLAWQIYKAYFKKIITSPFKNYTQKHANLEKVLETNINMKQ